VLRWKSANRLQRSFGNSEEEGGSEAEEHCD
jgi:hypothetical protein